MSDIEQWSEQGLLLPRGDSPVGCQSRYRTQLLLFYVPFPYVIQVAVLHTAAACQPVSGMLLLALALLSSPPRLPHFIIPSIIFHISHARYLSINLSEAESERTMVAQAEGKEGNWQGSQNRDCIETISHKNRGLHFGS